MEKKERERGEGKGVRCVKQSSKRNHSKKRWHGKTKTKDAVEEVVGEADFSIG